MLIFAIGLIAAAALMFGGLLAFLLEHLLALLCAVLIARLALKTGGGWPGALAAGTAAFTATSLVLRLSASYTRPHALRLLLKALTIIPAATVGFLLADTMLRLFVPAEAWRVILSLLAAASVATIVGQRQSVSSGPADGPNR